jgi:hypothetical protein
MVLRVDQLLAHIDERALACPVDWYLEPHDLVQRNEAYVEAGLPSGVLNVLTGSGSKAGSPVRLANAALYSMPSTCSRPATYPSASGEGTTTDQRRNGEI